MPSTRRQLLASSLGAVAALGTAGCIGDVPGTDGESPNDSPNDSPNGSPSDTEVPPPASAERTVGGADVTVFDIVAEKAVTYESLMGSGGVVAPEGRQFVVASVDTDAELTMDQFTLHAGGESWAAVDPGDEGAQNYSVAGHEGGSLDGPATGASDNRYVAFELDSPMETEEPRIVLENGGESGEWSLPDAAAETLAASAPSFELDSLSAPDSVTQGEAMTIELSVTNISDTDGRFLAAAYWPTELIADDDESHLIEQSVDAGASTTATLTIDTGYTTDEDGPITLRIEGHVSAEQEITVEDASTPT